jgi:SAM-dependent methyltransferase
VSALSAWARHRHELLDDPGADGPTVLASLADVVRSNRLLGGRQAALTALEGFLGRDGSRPPPSLLDVGTGLGDIPLGARDRARVAGGDLRILGVERHPWAARAAYRNGVPTVIADARALPFRGCSVDVVLCSQLLHHLDGPDADLLLRELDRVARRGAVVADLRRSVVAALGFLLIALFLRFHPVTRKDGVTSVLRGFTVRDLARLCRSAGVDATVRRHLGSRLTATWRPRGGPA